MSDMVVDEENVYIVRSSIPHMRELVYSISTQLDPNGEKHLLDETAATPAAVSRTWFIALVTSLYRKAVPKKEEEPVEEFVDEVEASETDLDASDVPGSGASTPKEKDGASTPVEGAPTAKAAKPSKRKNNKKSRR